MRTFENLLQPEGTNSAVPAESRELVMENRRRRRIREDIARERKDPLTPVRDTVYDALKSGCCLDDEGVRGLAMDAGLLILSPASCTEAQRAYKPAELLLREGESIPTWLSWDAARGQIAVDFPELSRRLISERGITLQEGRWQADGQETNEGGIRRIIKDVLDIVLPRSGRAVEEALRAVKTDAQKTADDLECSFCDLVAPERQRFLYAPWFPLGKLTIVQADGGTGKTTFLCTLAALLSKGLPLAGSPCTAGACKSLLISTEDDPGELSAKLHAADADCSQIILSSGLMRDGSALSFTSPKLEQMIRILGPKLVVFDPFQSFLGARTDMNRANETRPILARLAGIAERCDCAIVLVCHLGKSQKDAIYGALGSVDITASARSGLHLMRDPRQPEREADVLCFHFKHNNSPMGKTIRFRIDSEGAARILGAEDETLGSLTRELRRRELAEQQEQRQQQKAEESREAAEHSLLLPVLRQLLRENPNGLAISCADLIDCVFKMHGHCPYTQDKSTTAVGREVARLMSTLLENGWEVHSQTVRPCPFLFMGVPCHPKHNGDNSVRGIRFSRVQSQETASISANDAFSFAGDVHDPRREP